MLVLIEVLTVIYYICWSGLFIAAYLLVVNWMLDMTVKAEAKIDRKNEIEIYNPMMVECSKR